MALPPPPEGLRAVEDDDFRCADGRVPRRRVLAFGAVLMVLTALAWARWGGGEVGVAAVVIAACGLTAAWAAQRFCLRRDLPVVMTLAESETEATRHGPVTDWRFAAPVPEKLARCSVGLRWAETAEPGDRVPVRLQETGFGTLVLRLGRPTPDGWRLAAPQPAWPVAAQLDACLAFGVLVLVTAAAVAPSRSLSGEIVAAEQQPWELGPGTEPWRLTVSLSGPPRRVMLTLSHERFLGLLPERGRRTLAAPGRLPPEERARAVAQYLPLGTRVVLRETRLGSVKTTFYVGPET